MLDPIAPGRLEGYVNSHRKTRFPSKTARRGQIDYAKAVNGMNFQGSGLKRARKISLRSSETWFPRTCCAQGFETRYSLPWLLCTQLASLIHIGITFLLKGLAANRANAVHS